jgi:hypothetical protein
MSWFECDEKWVWVLSWKVLSVWEAVSAAGAEWWSAIADCLWRR